MKNSLRLTGVIILIAITGPLLWTLFFDEKHDVIVSVTAFAIGVVTFFGVAELSRSDNKEAFKGESLRTAIACSLVLSYLFIVCVSVFNVTPKEVGGVTQEMVKSFSNVIGVTIAFYFGASAATQIFSEKKDDGGDKKNNEKNV